MCDTVAMCSDAQTPVPLEKGTPCGQQEDGCSSDTVSDTASTSSPSSALLVEGKSDIKEHEEPQTGQAELLITLKPL